MVLNSLAGAAIPTSLGLLRRYGRFLELGKRDILEGAMLDFRPFDRSLSFIAANLDRDHPDFTGLLEGILADVERGVLRSLPVRVYAASRVGDAFTYMARARHLGKVVVTLGPVATADGLTDAHGVEAFRRVVEGPHVQVIVSTRDVAERIDRQRDTVAVLAEATSSPAATQAEAVTAPAENVERQVAAIWERVIGATDIGLDDNFFEIGGDSLAGVQVVSQLNARFRLNVPVARFFEAPTTRALAALVESLRADVPPVPGPLREERDRGARRRAALQRRRT